MKIISNTIISIFLGLFITACSVKNEKMSNKNIVVKNKEIETIYIQKIENDTLNLNEYLKEELLNLKKELTLNKNSSDAVIKTEILSSKMNFEHYYKQTDTIKCLSYRVTTNSRICIEYGKVKIPCNKKTFYLETKIDVIKQNKELLFSKVYKKTFSSNSCTKIKDSFKPSYKLIKNRDYQIKKYNSELAKIIAKESISEISKHLPTS